MNHQGTKVLETEHLLLRPFVMEDAPVMFANWASDPEVTKYLTWPTHPDPDVTRMVLQDWTSQYEKPDFYQWAIVLKEINEPIGCLSLVRWDDDIEEVELGYCIGRSWWRKGVTSEAVSALIPFLFDEVGANRICAKHDINNPGSGAVMKKCGLRYEGTHRQSARNNQGICDLDVYALIRSDWKTSASV